MHTPPPAALTDIDPKLEEVLRSLELELLAAAHDEPREAAKPESVSA